MAYQHVGVIESERSNGDVEYSSSDGKPSIRRNLSTIIILLTILNVLIAIAVIVLISMIAQNPGDAASYKNHKPEICVSCELLQQGIYGEKWREEDKSMVRTTTGTNDTKPRCCATNGVQLLRMLKLLVNRRLRLAKGDGSLVTEKLVYVDSRNGTGYLNEKPAAHLVGKEDDQRSQRHIQSTQSPTGISWDAIVTWNYTSNLTFIRDKIDHKDGRLIIPSQGLYFVYSQVSYHQQNQPNGNDTSRNHRSDIKIPISHLIYRYNPTYPNMNNEKLLEGTQSKCVAANGTGTAYTSFLGAVINLRAGDEVFVKVGNTATFRYNPKSSNFGLYLI